MKTGLTISTIAHLAVVVLGLLMMWGVMSFSKPMLQLESIPVASISETELNQIMQGSKTAPQAETPRPVVDKVAPEVKAPKNEAEKVVEKEKQEVAPSAAQPPPPETQQQQDTQSRDAIAEALQRDEARKKEEARKAQEAKRKEEARKRLEAKKREQEQKYNTDTIESRLAMLDKRAPQRTAATGTMLNQAPALGAATATGPTLSMNELAALQARLRDCWDVPVGVQNARDLVVTVRIQFNKDGSLRADPMVLNHSAHPVFQVAAESALRGIRKCAPFSFMPAAKYEAWKDVEVNFDPREMFGG